MPQHTPAEQARRASGNPNTPAPGPQAPQAQEMMPGGGGDPAQMAQEMGVQLAQTMGPEQAGALLVQIGQQIAQAGQGGA